MNRKRISQVRIMVLGSLTLLVVVAWVATEVYSGLTTDRITPQLETETEPLNPVLNLQILDELSSREELPVNFTTYDPNAFQNP